MSYNYTTEREALFTDDGQKMFIEIRDRVKHLLKVAGAFRMDQAIGGTSGSSWEMLACVDRLVELGEIVECTHPNRAAGQNRIFTDSGWNPY